MVIFSRGRGGGRHSRQTRPGGSKDPAADTGLPIAEDAEEAGEGGKRYTVHPAGPGDPAAGAEGEADGPGTGPYDIADAPEATGQRLDLGGMVLPVLENVEVRMEANPEGTIQQVVLLHRDSVLQLGVFAAPRTAGIWDEVREEIRQSLTADKVAVQEIDGPYGTELRARVRTPAGPTDVRFVGIDGPRWMVRALYQGRAAVDATEAAPLDACLHNLVVNRGPEAMPVREPIPLRLPRDMAEGLAAAQQAEQERQSGAAQPAGPPKAPAGVADTTTASRSGGQGKSRGTPRHGR